jgi:peptidoglycan L-alanyl-D-glutamate endopeptidase CwlK
MAKTNITEACRDIKALNPLAQILLTLAIDEIEKAGITPLLIETYRSQARQNYLYAQGRTRSGNKITWTLNSIHTKKNAVDLIPQRKVDGKMTAIWNSQDKETKKIIEIMTKYGWEAGANWATSKDSPHFQIKGVAVNGTTYSAKNNNVYVTKVIQKALNEKLGIHLVCDGHWGSLTTAAVNDFRKKNKWSNNGQLGVVALERLLG